MLVNPCIHPVGYYSYMKNISNSPKRRALYLVLIFPLLLLFTGCFEAKSEIEIRLDGSGMIKGELLISERMVIAMESADTSEGNMTAQSKTAFDETSFRKQIGDDVEIISLLVEDHPDGSRRILYEIEVVDIISYLNQQDENQMHKVRIVRLDDNTGAVEFGNGVDSGSMEIEFDQMYGLMKGFFAETKVTLPVSVSSEFLDVAPEGKSVTWTFDLRNREGLERAKQLDEKLDGEKPLARFTLADWDIEVESLPLASTGASAGVVSNEVENDGGVRAEVAVLKSTHQQKLVSDEKMERVRFSNLGQEEMEVHVMLTWDEESRPTNYKTVVIEEMVTDTGENLIKEGKAHSFSRDVNDRQDAVLASVKVNLPSATAKKIVFLKGYVPIVAGVEIATVQIENPLAKIGEGKLGNEALQSIGAYLKKVEGLSVKVVTEGKALDEIALLKLDGRRLKSGLSGRSGINNTYTYSYTFPESIETGDSLELTVRLSEEMAKVPFEARDILLP